MRSIEDIIYICEDRFTTYNRIIAKDICKNYTEDSIPLIMAVHKLVNLKENLIYGSIKQEEFFNELKNNNYNNNFEIITLLFKLFAKENNNKLEVINKYLNSPYINSIEKNNDSYQIDSKELGQYKVESISKYVNNVNINKSLFKKLLIRNCHKNVELLLNRYPNLYGVTAFCKPMFNKGSYYHSYCLDEENNKILDPSYKIVMEKEEYEKLFEPEEILKIKGCDLEKTFNVAIKHKYELYYYYDPTIAITLFQQYIWENELPTPNKELYSLEPSNKHLLIKNR